MGTRKLGRMSNGGKKNVQNWITKIVWRWQVATFPFPMNNVVLAARAFRSFAYNGWCRIESEKVPSNAVDSNRQHIISAEFGFFRVDKIRPKNFPAHSMLVYAICCVCNLRFPFFFRTKVTSPLFSSSRLESNNIQKVSQRRCTSTYWAYAYV